jgi:Pyruvate phosphate dikinase, AMP/ATP-binding domain
MTFTIAGTRRLAICVASTLLIVLGCSNDEESNPARTDVSSSGSDTSQPGNTAADAGPSWELGTDSDASPASDTEGGSTVSGMCASVDGEAFDFLPSIGCIEDFERASAEPADSSLPGARSVKTIIDRVDGNRLYFINTGEYPLHYDFASNHLSAVDELPLIASQAEFNDNYVSDQRRFYLGTITYYEGPAKWVYEITPYDTASAAMVEETFGLLRDATYFGKQLYFHPNGETVEAMAEGLPDSIPILTTDELYAGVDYQPLNLETSTGLLRFRTAAEVDGSYTPFREIVVLDAIPNDISIVSGIITAQFQTPLAHINVLSVNRGTPNMALRGATENADLLALEDKWVELTVGAFDWSIREITQEEADTWWEEHKPEPLVVQTMDLTVTDMREASEMIDSEVELGDGIQTAIRAFGAKATNYGAMADAQLEGAFDDLPDVDGEGPIAPGFGIPMFYYDQFMKDNELYDRIQTLMAAPEWADPELRAETLKDFKDELRTKPVRQEVIDAVVARADELFPGENIRFRSSTNSEDLGKFTGAGLYDSETGVPGLENDLEDSVAWAMKKVWSQVWNPRAYEEREYFSMNHLDVGMALLVHANFPEEEAQGVAITNNPFDTTGTLPAFFVNAQEGNNDVVTPDLGVTPDAYLQYYYNPGQPIVYTQHSSLVPEGDTVLTADESQRLGIALNAIHRYFASAYSDVNEWYALEVDFKFDDKLDADGPRLFIKQARPYPGRN